MNEIIYLFHCVWKVNNPLNVIHSETEYLIVEELESFTIDLNNISVTTTTSNNYPR